MSKAVYLLRESADKYIFSSRKTRNITVNMMETFGLDLLQITFIDLPSLFYHFSKDFSWKSFEKIGKAFLMRLLSVCSTNFPWFPIGINSSFSSWLLPNQWFRREHDVRKDKEMWVKLPISVRKYQKSWGAGRKGGWKQCPNLKILRNSPVICSSRYSC